MYQIANPGGDSKINKKHKQSRELSGLFEDNLELF